MSLLELFCHVDTFCQAFVPHWDQQLRVHGQRVRQRSGQLALSEIMTILILFHQLRFRDFKTFYLVYVLGHLHREFPQAVSYQCFVELMPSTLGPLCAYLQTCFGTCSGLSFVDATALAVCHNRRISRHRVFRDLAQRGKTSLGWFYGFKLHIVINHYGELIACQLTPGNVDDRRPVPKLAERLWGRLFGDKGYVTQPLSRELFLTRRVRLVTHLRRKMVNRLLLLHDKELDPANRGVSASALLSNQEARTYYEQDRTWNITRSKRRLKPTRQSPVHPMSVKPDRDIGRVRQRYHRLNKSELVERLIVAEQDHASCQERWLTTADEVLTWQQRAVAAEAQLKKLRDKEKHKT